MKIVAKTDKGKVRENNQDAYAVGELPGDVAWAVVCDGMGGAAGGNIASALAVKVISDKITASYNERMKDASIKNLLDSAITAANIEVYDMAYTRPELKGMGTTVVCAIIRKDVAYIAHAGDSRAYIVDDKGVEQITVDHSLVQDLVNKGEITAEQAEKHPNKNIITRALGVDKRIEIDYSEVDICNNETLLLCTDGLTNYVTPADIFEQIKDGQYYAFADRLVKMANNNGGGDNITVVAIAN
ncbi:MAG: Stp1/IreP family PP2C-type Ser/Thr phosphatase [Eubacterium sp.]